MSLPQDTAWQEVKQELGRAFRIVGYVILTLGALVGAAYVYFSYFN